MMKRILALLLAVMLLPAGALAEAFRLEWSIDMNAENAVTVIRQAGIFSGMKNEADLAAALVDLLDGFSLQLVTQEGASRMDIVLDETTLLDLSLFTGGENAILTSDMMGGAGFCIPAALFSAENDQLVALLAEVQWEQLLSGMVISAAGALADVEITTARGSFAGDAFTGGVCCTTIILDDADIAAFLDALLTEDVRALVRDVADYFGADGAALLADADAANDRAAADNAYRYIIRLVMDAEGEVIGLSGTILQGEKQLATLSVGLNEDGMRIVAGLPMDEVNYWHVHDFTLTKAGQEGSLRWTMSGSILEFCADKMEDFASASAHVMETKFRANWSAEVAQKDGGYTWTTLVSQRQGDSIVVEKTENQGLYVPGVRFENVTTNTRAGKQWMTETILWEPCDPIDDSAEGLMLVDVTSEDTAAIEEIALSMGYELAIRLLQVIPTQLLVYLQ